MFRIKAEYAEQLELKTTIEKARVFFGELRNFVELMPGIETITDDVDGVCRWIVSADVPLLGSIRAAFPVAQTIDLPYQIEWSPAEAEQKNFLRYFAEFEGRGARTLVKIVQRVEMRRENAKDLHMLAGFVGESRISAEMQKYVTQMIQTFLQRARLALETGS